MNKTANTTENKASFMAQYWGQKVFVHPILSVEPMPNVYIFDSENPEDIEQEYLSLKSLEEITDEDLCKCYHLGNAIGGYDGTMDFDSTINMAFHWKEHGGRRDMERYTQITDYLRSKGYLIGWRDLTPDEIIAYGWAKTDK